MKSFRIPKAKPTRSLAHIDQDLAVLAQIIERHIDDLTEVEQAFLDRLIETAGLAPEHRVEVDEDDGNGRRRGFGKRRPEEDDD